MRVRELALTCQAYRMPMVRLLPGSGLDECSCIVCKSIAILTSKGIPKFCQAKSASSAAENSQFAIGRVQRYSFSASNSSIEAAISTFSGKADE